MSTHEVYAAYEFIYSTLANDSALSSLAVGGVWRGLAPPKTASPFIILGFQAGSDKSTMNAVRLLSMPLLQIKACGPATMTPQVAATAAALDGLLKNTKGTIDGTYINSCSRESPLGTETEENGETWTFIGGMYRLEIQQMN